MKKLTVIPSRTETTAGLIFLAFQLLVLQLLLILGNQLFGNPLSPAQLNFVFFCINFLCVTIIMHQFLIRSAKLALRNVFYCLQTVFFGFCLHWLSNILFSVALQMLYPGFFNVNDNSILELTRENYSLMAIGTVLLVPVTEELLYRGLIFGKLYNRSRIAGYLVSAVAFSALHVVGYIGIYSPLHLLVCFLQYIPASLCLAWVYARSDTIAAPILLHISLNQIAILSMR